MPLLPLGPCPLHLTAAVLSNQKRVNMFKQLGCVTSIYDKRHKANKKQDHPTAGESGAEAAAAEECDPYDDGAEVPLRALLRNGPRIEASFPGMVRAQGSRIRC